MKPAPDRIYDTLKRYWGFTEFRPVQLEIIRSVLEGRDTLALMPTGGGKSLTYQVPTLAREGLCIVVTPLIALMKDQVDRLRARAVPAVQQKGWFPVILCSEAARALVKSSTEREIPDLVVLSVPEIVSDVRVEAVGEIRLEG